MNEQFKFAEKLEYHIYELIESKRNFRYVTDNYNEAVAADKANLIVYEVRECQAFDGWMTTTTTISYEWHRGD